MRGTTSLSTHSDELGFVRITDLPAFGRQTARRYQLQLAGRLPEACEAFHQASTKDETDVSALYGIIHARILEGNLEEAEEQLEFLSEIQVHAGITITIRHQFAWNSSNLCRSIEVTRGEKLLSEDFF